MQSMVPLACFLSIIRPPGVQYENALLQITPVDKSKCPFVKDSSDIGFQLFTRHNPTVYQELMVGDDERLFASNMDFHAPTVIYFHAFMEQPDDGSGIMVREAYMQRGDTNVIMVAAQRLEAGPWYFTAAQNTWYIGRFAATFIDYMVSRGLQLNNTHLVGHSLGAQAAGVAGSALTTGRVSRITGLDPALPLFNGLPLEQRLDASDAVFVDIIHTDAGIFGYKEPIGHVDFYPNGGKSPQPGCELEVVIPQQLLLNKCDGKENTRGFYTYYLASNAAHQHDSTEHSAINQMKPLRTGSKMITLDSSRVQHTSTVKNKSTTHADVDTLDAREVRRFTPTDNYLRKKRVKRNITTTSTEGNKLQNKREQRTTVHTPADSIPTNRQQPRTDEHTRRNNDQQNPLKDEVNVNNTIMANTPTPSTGLHADRHTNKHANERQKRFVQLFRTEDDNNFIFRALNFLVKNRKSFVPIVSVVRDVSTLVRSGNGELNHVAKERNSYVGVSPPDLAPVTYSLELANESKMVAFVKKLFGLAPKGDRLTIGSG